MTAEGRYCPPKICYCGGCPWWTPIPDPDYSRLAAIAERAAAAQRKSWEARDESTWLEEL